MAASSIAYAPPSSCSNLTASTQPQIADYLVGASAALIEKVVVATWAMFAEHMDSAASEDSRIGDSARLDNQYSYHDFGVGVANYMLGYSQVGSCERSCFMPLLFKF